MRVTVTFNPELCQVFASKRQWATIDRDNLSFRIQLKESRPLPATIHYMTGLSYKDVSAHIHWHAIRPAVGVRKKDNQMLQRLVSLAFLSAFTVVVSGCSLNGSFYPVQGTLASQSPAPVYVVKFTAHPPTSLSVSGAIANEKVSGTLIRTLPAPKQAPNVPVPPPMTSQWDAVYGLGTYTAHVLGSGQDARGVLTGAAGTTFDVEIHTGHAANGTGIGRLEGVAQDSKGNLYKVVF